jgi:opacity protein-like surface antigen
MVKKALLGAIAAAFVAAPPAAADPPAPNGHNCAGVVVSGAAGPGFGQFVAFFAHQQAVDNFNLANCGNTNRKNP